MAQGGSDKVGTWSQERRFKKAKTRPGVSVVFAWCSRECLTHGGNHADFCKINQSVGLRECV